MENSSEDFKRQASEMIAQALRATEDRVAEVKRRAGKRSNKEFTGFVQTFFQNLFNISSVPFAFDDKSTIDTYVLQSLMHGDKKEMRDVVCINKDVLLVQS